MKFWSVLIVKKRNCLKKKFKNFFVIQKKNSQIVFFQICAVTLFQVHTAVWIFRFFVKLKLKIIRNRACEKFSTSFLSSNFQIKMYIIYYKKTQHNTRSESFKMKYDLKLLTKKKKLQWKKTDKSKLFFRKKNIFENIVLHLLWLTV